MELHLQHDNVLIVDQIHQSVLVGDAARPRAGEHVPQQFRLADAVGRVPQRIIDEPLDALENLPVNLFASACSRPNRSA